MLLLTLSVNVCCGIQSLPQKIYNKTLNWVTQFNKPYTQVFSNDAIHKIENILGKLQPNTTVGMIFDALYQVINPNNAEIQRKFLLLEGSLFTKKMEKKKEITDCPQHETSYQDSKDHSATP